MLDEPGRERAIEVGTALYAEFGDETAKPRLENLLRLGLSRKTGTRTGASTSAVAATDLSDAGARAAFLATFLSESARPALDPMAQVMKAFGKGVARAAQTGSNAFAGDYYAVENCEPAEYWRARDAMWTNPTVEVLPLQSVPSR